MNFPDIPISCSYRAGGCQRVGPFVLGALIDSELGVFGVLRSGVRRSKVQCGQSTRRCWWALTWRRVGGGRGVHWRQGGVPAARARLLSGGPLKETREKKVMHLIYDNKDVNTLAAPHDRAGLFKPPRMY